MFVLAVLLSILGDGANLAFEYPIFLAISPDRTIYVADQDVPAIFRISPDGKAGVLFRGEKKYRTPLYRPRDLAFGPDGNLYVADPATMDVYRVSPDGKAVGLTGKPIKPKNGPEVVMGEIVQPEGLAVAADGAVFVSDLRLGQIVRIAGGKTEVLVKLPAPRGLAIDKDGTLLVISNSAAQLYRVDPAAKTSKPVIQGAPFQFPMSVAVLPSGEYVVTDNYAKALWRVTKEGQATRWIEGDPLDNPTDVAVDKDGNVAVADPRKRTIFWISPAGKISVAASRQ